jgi:hypothetical protein
MDATLPIGHRLPTQSQPQVSLRSRGPELVVPISQQRALRRDIPRWTSGRLKTWAIGNVSFTGW